MIFKELSADYRHHSLSYCHDTTEALIMK